METPFLTGLDKLDPEYYVRRSYEYDIMRRWNERFAQWAKEQLPFRIWARGYDAERFDGAHRRALQRVDPRKISFELLKALGEVDPNFRRTF